MTLRALAALAGTIASLGSPAPWPPFAAALLAGLAVLALLHGRLAAALCCAAAVCTQLAIHSQLASMVREETRVLVEARVISLPVRSSQLAQFDVRACLTRLPGRPVLALRVRWRGAPAGAPRAGERWQLALQLRVPRSPDSPGAVDGLRVLWRDHLAGRAEVVGSPLNRRLDAQAPLLPRLRARVADHILATVADPAAAALLAALAVGHTGEVGRDAWQVYNATGITHLIAISGLHVTLFATLVMAALRRAWTWWPALARRLRRESFVAVAGVACAATYALLAGNSVPSQRTVLMLAAGLTWRGFARASSPASALGAALVAVLAIDPFAVLAAGFWLSFGAVGVILWREGSRLRAPAGLGGALRLQLAITAALVPATIANFATVSLAGLLVNPVAIPLFSFALVPLVLAAALAVWSSLPIVGDVLLALAAAIATPTQAALTRIAHLPGGVWNVEPHASWYAFSIVACLLCVLPLGARVRCLAVAALLPLFCPPERPPPGGWRALRLTSGAATVSLVVTHRHGLIVGTGDAHGTRGGRVPALIVPAARRLGLGTPDRLIAGRLDADVAAGIGAARALLSIREISAAPDREGRLPAGLGDCRALGRWEWDGVAFEAGPGPTPASCVLRIGPPGAILELSAAARSRGDADGAELIEADATRGLRRRALGPGPGVWHHRPPDGA